MLFKLSAGVLWLLSSCTAMTPPFLASEPSTYEQVEATLLADPVLNQSIEQERARSQGSESYFRGLEVSAIATLNNYALVEWIAVIGDLPLEGQALLQNQEGHWQVLDETLGDTIAGANPATLAAWDVPAETIPRLLAEFEAAGALIEPAPSGFEQLNIGGITLNAYETRVYEILGTPSEVTDEATGCCGNLRTLIYPNATVSLIEGPESGLYEVYSLYVRSPELSTTAGLRIGDSRQQVIDLYGLPDREEVDIPEEAINSMIYELGEGEVILQITLKADEVVQIGYAALIN